MKKEFPFRIAFRSLFLIAFLFIAGTIHSSCGDKSDGEPAKPAESWVKVDKSTHTMTVGERVTLVPTFSSDAVKARPFEWTSSDREIATVTRNADGSADVVAVAAGTATIRIAATQDAALNARCVLTVKKSAEPEPEPEPEPDGIVRILAVGNSFSVDALEQYLWELADAEGIRVVIGNMYIGGCSLSTHVANAAADKAAYSYRKIVDGVKTTTADVRLSAALADERWDYISLQQVSGYSGIYSSFESTLPELAAYVAKHAANPAVKLILHQTWAYAANSGHADFGKYDKNQMTMYRAIVETYDKAAGLIGADRVVPVGTAIQNGRTSYLGDSFCRDGYHLETTYGRYTAACTWFEAIFGRDVTRNTYKPSSISTHVAELARAAAHHAVQTPGAVTELTDYKVDPELEEMPYGIYVDFGSSVSAAPWNNLSSVSSTAPVSLLDSEGAPTGISIRISKAFGGINTEGPSSTDAGMYMPSSASSDSFWGNTGEAFRGTTTGPTELIVDALDPAREYVFTFFSGRKNCSDNRSTQFTVSGTNSDVLVTDAANNTDRTAVSRAIAPDREGRIVVSLTSGPDNDNKNGFFYINTMRIAPVQ